MKLKALIVICILLPLSLTAHQVPITKAQEAKSFTNKWAVIVCGSDNRGNEAEFLHWILSEYYDFDDIYFLHVNTSKPGVDALSNKTNVRWALTNWTAARSGPDDLVFIWIASHGGGFLTRDKYRERNEVVGGRAEVSWDDEGKPAYSDEGNETKESTIWNPDTLTYGLDVNKDDDLDDWVGVDECIWLEADDSKYWDDELFSDLSGLSYSRLAIVNVVCFAGGFIDDLSGSNRIIMTPTNETHYAYQVRHVMSDWGKQFISALHVGTPSFYEADANDDGKLSFGELFDFVWEYDVRRQSGDETPWLDDNGDGYPTYLYERDWSVGGDGDLADQTLLPAPPPPTPPPPVQEHHYTPMGGITTSCGHLLAALWDWKWMWTCPFATRPPNLTPGTIWQNVAFSDPDPTTGIVYLTVPAESYVGIDHVFYDPFVGYCRFRLTMDWDGYGWLFTGIGTSPILGDVDCYTLTNNTGVYWTSSGQRAAVGGQFPSPGPDAVAGTDDDDDFGDGTPDPPGSSILYLPTTLNVDYWTGTEWKTLYDAPWPQIMTTATAYNIVAEPESYLNGVNSTVVGHAWEFFHSGLNWGDPKSNAFVTYVCALSALRILTPPHALFLLDVHFKVVETKVREDVYNWVMGDADLAGLAYSPPYLLVDMMDISLAQYAAFSYDEGLGTPVAHPRFDARCDIDGNGVVDMMDIAIMCYNYLHQYTIDDC